VSGNREGKGREKRVTKRGQNKYKHIIYNSIEHNLDKLERQIKKEKKRKAIAILQTKRFQQ
jgi:ribosome-associated translation inhibitor RaiA